MDNKHKQSSTFRHYYECGCAAAIVVVAVAEVIVLLWCAVLLLRCVRHTEYTNINTVDTCSLITIYNFSALLQTIHSRSLSLSLPDWYFRYVFIFPNKISIITVLAFFLVFCLLKKTSFMSFNLNISFSQFPCCRVLNSEYLRNFIKASQYTKD